MVKLTCKDLSALQSRAMDASLSPAERALVQAHLAVCAGCRFYTTQLDLLRKFARRYADGGAGAFKAEPGPNKDDKGSTDRR